jgi:NADPH-dependent glutamate synthase beta subunit-like oxidoreductase
MFCLESREEMPAHPWEIALAEEEGVFIHNSWAPKKVLGKGRVEGLGLMRCSSVFDRACNFNPVYDEEITHRVEADSIVLAVGQRPTLAFQDGESGLRVERDRVVVKSEDLSADGNGVFAGGDVVTGPASIISAIAQGRRAAEAMDRYLGGSGDISETLADPEEALTLPEFRIEVKPRTDMARLKAWERSTGFDQVELGMSEAQARTEASRCLSCDARKFEVVLQTEYCKECGYCAEVCQVGTFGPASGFNAKGYKPMEVKTTDHCVGCLKCFFACPDFAIDVKGK